MSCDRAAVLTVSSLPFFDRQQLKAAFFMSVESSEGLLNEIGSQALASGTYTSPASVVEQIESVTTADVVNVSLAPVSHCNKIRNQIKQLFVFAFSKGRRQFCGLNVFHRKIAILITVTES